MKILSVDIGIKNFGMSVYCTSVGRFTSFEVLRLGKVKDYVAAMRALTSTEPFVSADVILVENQMRQCMRTMATAIRCFHFDKTIRVAPQSIKKHFETCTRSHRSNKKAAVVQARQYLSDEMLQRFDELKKKDDIADCILQTMWYLDKQGKRDV